MDELTSIPGLDIDDEPTRTAPWRVALAAAGAVVGGALVIASVIAAGGEGGLQARDFAVAVVLLGVVVGAVLGGWHGIVGRVRADAADWDSGVPASTWHRERDVVLAAARRHPARHRRRIRGLALLGRLAPVVAMESLWMLVALCFLSVVLVGGLLSLLVVPLAAAIAVWALQFTRALRSIARAAAIDGATVVSRREAPALHAFVDEVADLLGARAPHELAIGDGLDVRLRSWPSSWWQLRPRRRLTFGFQLLASLPVDELRALVTIELGHVAVRTDEARVELASSQAFWLHAWRRLDRERAVPSLIGTVAAWFLYRSQRLLLATDRVEDRAADRRVQQLVDAGTARRALVRTALLERRIERAHRDFVCDHAAKSTPPTGRARQLVAGLHAPPITAATAPSQLVHMLLDEADALQADGLRPSLIERCHGVGAPVVDGAGRLSWTMVQALARELVVPLPSSAAQGLLGASAQAVGGRLDAAWMRRAEPQWRNLVGLAIAGDERTARGGGAGAVRLQRDPAEPVVQVERAVARIFAGDADGWSALRVALPLAPETIEAVVPRLTRYARAFGDHALAGDLDGMLALRRSRVATAQAERAGFDWLEAPLAAGQLDPLRLALLHEGLAALPQVRAAWLVEHRFAGLTGEPAWAVAVRLDSSAEAGDSPESYEHRQLQERLGEWLTRRLGRGIETWLAVDASHLPSPVGARIAAVPEARTYLRDGESEDGTPAHGRPAEGDADTEVVELRPTSKALVTVDHATDVLGRVGDMPRRRAA